MHAKRFVAIAALLLVAADGPDPAKKELAALEGTWTMISLEVEGQKVSEDRVQGSELVIKDGKYIVTTRGKRHETALTLDPTQKPKHIDMVFADGENKDKPHRGIYEIDGDTLRVCRSLDPEFSRPKEFATSPGTGLFLVVWKRR
jgi:uncharacterized protein (TIGR03067 family)